MTEGVEAKKGPWRVELLEGYQYAWCTCGLSAWQPFCDGAYTLAPPAQPRVFIQVRDQTVLLCGCKRTGNPPFCDGSHNKPGQEQGS